MLDIGVCGWCINRHDVLRGIQTAGKQLDLRVVQIGFFTKSSLQTASAEAILQAVRAANVTIAGSFVAFEGEDYSSIERIAATGGYSPDDTYDARLRITREAAALTTALGCNTLAVHAGTIPTDPTSPIYTRLLKRTGEVADAVREHDVRLLLETGREPVDTLIGFMDAAGRENLGVNFDPGNLVIYGTDEPARAVSRLKGRIECVHLKDAIRSPQPGIEYGKTAPLGSGDAGIARVVSKLRSVDYTGPLLLEVRPSSGDLTGIRSAIDYLRSMSGWDIGVEAR